MIPSEIFCTLWTTIPEKQVTTPSIKDRIRQEPDLFLRIAQSSMTVAASVRKNFLDNTLDFAELLREQIKKGEMDGLVIHESDLKLGKEQITTCFIDGGVGEAEIFFRVPLIVRGGIFRIKEGEHDLQRRETFEFFPVLIGNLEGGEKGRHDYSTVVRIIIELCSILRVLSEEKYKDVSLIMLHGPLLYRLSAYSPHWFYKKDIDVMTEGADELIQQFEESFRDCPVVFGGQHHCWCYNHRSDNTLKANCFISFLLNMVILVAQKRGVDLIGVVERAEATEITHNIMVKALKSDSGVTEKFLGRPLRNYEADAEQIIRSTNYNDSFLFSLILNPGEYISFYDAKDRYSGFVGELADFEKKLPLISYTYLKPVQNALAIRVEFPTLQVPSARIRALCKTYEYSRLLPNYAFPVGLDIADKFAKVPAWMVEAYKKYVLFNFGRLAIDQQLNQEELERVLLFYYLHQREFNLRPKA
ncbi:MAG: DNA double-strand break repair nuclease NurA [Ignavibacteriae bacterium]|nr:DNA double-strand break repair nuclease NurA [Ignavibacteriota bacterium]